MPAPLVAAHGVACVADVAAAAHVVGMQYIQTHNLAAFFGYPAVALTLEEGRAGFSIQQFLLGKGDAVLHYLVPYGSHGGQVGGRIGSHGDFRHHLTPFQQ